MPVRSLSPIAVFVGLVLAGAGVSGAVATAAAPSAKPATQKKAKARAHLRRALLRDPRLIGRRTFARRAALVNFKLPVTVRLRGSNSATVDLGASLGPRQVGLGGSLAAEISFRDSHAGGPLGSVGVDLLPSPAKQLVTTSIPLLWNAQVSTLPWDPAAAGGTLGGCAGFTGPSAGALPYSGGTIPVTPGVDDPARLRNATAVGDPDNLGSPSSDFPYPPPYGPGSPPPPADAVLRTAPLTLAVAAEGTTVQQDSASPNGPQGAPNIVIGRSGGEANLFGNIPGKQHAVEVTVSLATRFSSILRIVDPDPVGLVAGQPWTPDVLACRQLYTGAVQNYLPGLRLVGDLRIAPAITPDGHLRIARVTLHSAGPAPVALAACLAPYSAYAAPAAGSDTQTTLVPAPLPLDPSAARPPPTGADCGATPTRLIDDMFDPPAAGSRVTVAGDIRVTAVAADVIIGDV